MSEGFYSSSISSFVTLASDFTPMYLCFEGLVLVKLGQRQLLQELLSLSSASLGTTHASSCGLSWLTGMFEVEHDRFPPAVKAVVISRVMKKLMKVYVMIVVPSMKRASCATNRSVKHINW